MAKSFFQKQLEEMNKKTQRKNELLKKGYTFVSISELEKYRSVIDKQTHNKLMKAIFNGDNEVPILPQKYYQLSEKLQKEEEKRALLSKCAELNNLGIAYEKAGEIDRAIEVYEENIELGYPAHHSFKRLMILYHRNKDYQSELRVIKIACKVFPKHSEYKERRTKTQELIKKEKQKK